MALQDADEIIEGGLSIPIGRKVYHVAEPTAREGIRLQLLFHNPNTNLTDVDELREIKRLVGPVWDQMNADGVGWSKMMHAGRTALFKYGLGDENAETFWNGGLEALGKGLNPLPRRDPRDRVAAVVARVNRRAFPVLTALMTQEEADTFRRLGLGVGTSILNRRRRKSRAQTST